MLWRLCMALLFCLMPLEAAFSCDKAGNIPVHHASIACHSIDTDNHAGHDSKAGNILQPCCGVCLTSPCFIADTEFVAPQPVAFYYSQPVPALVGANPLPPLQPPLFS